MAVPRDPVADLKRIAYLLEAMQEPGYRVRAFRGAQAAGRGEARDLIGTQLRQRGRRAAEGADAIRGLLHRLEQVGDPLQVGDRVA